MKKILVRIMVWIAVMSVLTLIAMGSWVLCGGNQTTASLKWFQFVQTLATFLLPPILCAWMWDERHRPFTWLKMDRKPDGRLIILAVGIMVCAVPAINLLADLNSRLRLPDSMAGLEQRLRAMEDAAAVLTEQFLKADNIGMLLVNIGMTMFRADGIGEYGAVISRIFQPINIYDITSGTLFALGTDRHDFLVIVIGVAIMYLVAIMKEKGKDILTLVSTGRIYIKWPVMMGLIVAVLVFGAYGPGYGVVENIYAQF